MNKLLIMLLIVFVGTSLFGLSNKPVSAVKVEPSFSVPDMCNDFQPKYILAQINLQRTLNGVNKVTVTRNLDNFAQIRANQMAFSNYSHDGFRPTLENLGLNGYYGENLSTKYCNAHEVTDAWMNSPTHRKNLLNPIYKHIGFGYHDYVIVTEYSD